MLSTSHEEIMKHQANCSPSKQQFTFPKSSRFPSVPAGNAWVQYEEDPTGLGRVKYSIGTGPRSDFTKSPAQRNPAPTAYKESPGIAGKRNMAWKSAASRGLLQDEHKHETLTFPGPGAYDSFARVSMGNLGEKYSMRMKTAAPAARLRTPGPGAYDPKEQLDSVGKYSISKYQSSGAMRMPQAEDKLSSSFETPGPGAYEPKTSMAKTGQYFITFLKNSGSRSFGRAARKEFPGVKKDTPGPGAYRHTSEFGLYEHVPAKSSRPSTSNINARRDTSPS